MEIVKKRLHRKQISCRSTLQFTLDEDINVPDSKPDMGQLITCKSNIHITEERFGAGKYYVKGALTYQLLYLNEDGAPALDSLNGRIPFDEVIHLDADCERGEITLRPLLEDLSASMIHSRKFSIKALLRLNLIASELVDEESAIKVNADPNVASRYEQMEMTNVAVSKREVYRYRDSIMISSGKPEISRILFCSLEPRNVEFRMQTDCFLMKGDMNLCILYENADGDQVTEVEELPFSTSVAASGICENMPWDICWRLGEWSITPQTDNDGEERSFDIEATIELQILCYEEEDLELLKDLYATDRKLEPIYKEATCGHLLAKNTGKVRVNDKVVLPEGMPRIAQLLFSLGEVKLDSVAPVDGGLEAEGAVEVGIFYRTEDSKKPVQTVQALIPFQTVLEIPGMLEIKPKDVLDYQYEVYPSIDQISAICLDASEVEVKCALSLDTIAMEQRKEMLLVDVKESPYEEEELLKRPSVVCYYPKPGEDLWEIAKRYHTTLESIQRNNEGTTKRLLII